MPKLRKARDFAVHHHGSQRYGEHPYVYHLDQVVEILEPYGENAQVLGYLHDVVEDTAATPQIVQVEFGRLIAECVCILTDEPGIDRRERKRLTYRKMSAVRGELELALIVKAADRLANIRSCLESAAAHRLATYRSEFDAFHQSAFRPGLCDELWAQLMVLNDRSAAMLRLPEAARRWPNQDFAVVLAREIEGLHQDTLPLHKALTQGGRIDANPIAVTVLQVTDADKKIAAKVGVMFVEIVGGCSCGDEPAGSPHYCELSLIIDKQTGDTQVQLIGDS
jgi:hypothetical protein